MASWKKLHSEGYKPTLSKTWLGIIPCAHGRQYKTLTFTASTRLRTGVTQVIVPPQNRRSTARKGAGGRSWQMLPNQSSGGRSFGKAIRSPEVDAEAPRPADTQIRHEGMCSVDESPAPHEPSNLYQFPSGGALSFPLDRKKNHHKKLLPSGEPQRSRRWWP